MKLHRPLVLPLMTLAATVLPAGLASANPFELTQVGRFVHSPNFDAGASEISAYDAASKRLFVVNGEIAGLDVLDLSDPTNPVLVDVLRVGSGEVTSSAVYNNVVAVTASEGDGLPGTISFFKATTGQQLGTTLTVGPTPDQVVFTPNGRQILIAFEGEPDYDAGLDPDGSIGIFEVPGKISPKRVAALTAADLKFITFDSFNSQIDELRAAGVRIYGNPEDDADGPFGFNSVTVAQDLEPEFITVSANSRTAWVTLQENNALAIVDLVRGKVTDVVPLGAKDHSVPGQGLDASDRDGAINIRTWPVNGLYMSDAIDNYRYRGQTYLVLANEGDDRSGEDERIGDLFADGRIDTSVFTDPTLFTDPNLGRLDVSVVSGDADGDGLLEELNAFGARSFTIRDQRGNIVFDSGDVIEQQIARAIPANFNADNDDPEFDNKSDAQGPEPEGIEIGRIGRRTLCFVGMEDVGGIMTFDVTNPHQVEFQSYFNGANFNAQFDEDEPDFDPAALGDTGPEGITFISRLDSPNGRPLLVVSYEVTGTTTIYEVGVACSATDVDGSGRTTLRDGLAVVFGLGRRCKGCSKDVDGDGKVTFSDYLLVIENIKRCH